VLRGLALLAAWPQTMGLLEANGSHTSPGGLVIGLAICIRISTKQAVVMLIGFFEHCGLGAALNQKMKYALATKVDLDG
jgi:hypothetical protein